MPNQNLLYGIATCLMAAGISCSREQLQEQPPRFQATYEGTVMGDALVHDAGFGFLYQLAIGNPLAYGAIGTCDPCGETIPVTLVEARYFVVVGDRDELASLDSRVNIGDRVQIDGRRPAISLSGD